MTPWSQSEAVRTLDEVRRRSLIDPEFRALALSNPEAALAKVNPRPMPAGSVRFVETKDAVQAKSNKKGLVIVLPDQGANISELNDEDLDDVAGGSSGYPAWFKLGDNE